MSETLKKKSFWILFPALLITAGFVPHLLQLGSASGPVDTDGDGLEDSWEMTHFGDLTSQDGNGDPDGDGYFNQEEHDLGLDPNVVGGVPGYLSHQAWTGIEGVAVDDLINHPNFYQAPEINELVLGAENSLGLNSYGSRLRGTITAPVTGSYTFWVAGDDSVEMWLSSDDRKFNRQRIAWHVGHTSPQQWDKSATQQSAPVALEAGQKYYFEVLHKEGVGGDHVSVAWSYEADDLKNWVLEPGVVASQKTTAFNGSASRAIDGNKDGYYWAKSTTHTSPNGSDNWWQVDLGVDRSVERVVLYNRADCCLFRLSNFRISVLDASGNELASQDYHTEDGHVASSLIWNLGAPVLGRTVRVQLLGKNLNNDGVLSLAEVEVMGSESGAGGATPLGYLTNWTQEAGVTANQSTTDFSGVASRAIDGNRNGDYNAASVTHTDRTSVGNWWQTDLGAVRGINRVVIYNRTGGTVSRLSNFRIVLLDSSGAELVHKDFFTEEGYGEYQVKWDVPFGVSAQVVRIERLGPNRLGDQVLSFAEVEVLGAQGMLAGAIQGQELIPAGVLESYVLDPDDPDDDGLPSAWETQYGFDPNSAGGFDFGVYGDPDNDLIANWQEYQLGTDPTVATSVHGALTEEVWTDIPGGWLEDLYNSPKYNAGADIRRLVYQSEATRFLGSNTGTRVRGYIEAPVTGEYRFWLSGSAEVRCWLSMTDSKFDKELIISPHLFSAYRHYGLEASQQSAVISLVAGQKCFVEMHYKERGAGGYSPVSLAWQPPGGTRTRIPSEHLYSFIRDANDQDDDDLPDDWELANGLDPADNGITDLANGYYGDLDGDGLANYKERELGTRADLADTDGDGVSDFVEAEILGTEALSADVAAFQSVQVVNGASYTDSHGEWQTSGAQAYSTSVRGWVEYEVNVPSAGVYLLDLAMSPRLSGALSDQYKMNFSIDGQDIGNVTAVIAEGGTGSAKMLTPWLNAGTHTVRIFNDNALTFRTINLHTLGLLSAQGGDSNNNGRPDWVDTRLSTLNALETPVTQSTVSPVSIEGRARYGGLVSLSTGTAVSPLAGDRWKAEVELDAQTPVSLQTSFENGGLITSQPIEWVPTNLLAETAITLRQGDALRLSAYGGVAASSSDEVWLTVDGVTHHFTGDEPMEWHFDTVGTQVLNVVYRQGSSTSDVTHSVTVTVIEPVTIVSPVCVPTHTRRWDVPQLPAGAILEIDDRVEIRDTEVLANGTTRYSIMTQAPDTYYANVRLGVGGPILQTIAIRGMTVRDSDRASVMFIENYEDGSYRVDMKVVVDNLHQDVRVNYNIIIAGVTFDTGEVNKDYLPADFNDLGQATVTFIKTGTDGSACHTTKVWQGDVLIAAYF